MRHLTWFPRIIQALIALAMMCATTSAQTQTSVLATSKDFSERIKAYVDLRKMAEKTLPPMKSSNDEAEITAHQTALRTQLLQLRREAHQGDIFSKELAVDFRKTVRDAVKGPGGDAVRQTIVQGDVAKPFPLQVNGIYPDTIPLQTTPPTVLKVLPALPMELSYRFVGRSLVLLDNKTNLIVDFLPETLP